MLCPSLTIPHLLFLCWRQRSPSKQFDFFPCKQRPGPAHLCLSHVAVRVCTGPAQDRRQEGAGAVPPWPLAWHGAGTAAGGNYPGSPEDPQGCSLGPFARLAGWGLKARLPHNGHVSPQYGFEHEASSWCHLEEAHKGMWSVNGCRFLPVSDVFSGLKLGAWLRAVSQHREGEALLRSPPLSRFPRWVTPRGWLQAGGNTPLFSSFKTVVFLFRVRAGQEPAHSQ